MKFQKFNLLIKLKFCLFSLPFCFLAFVINQIMVGKVKGHIGKERLFLIFLFFSLAINKPSIPYFLSIYSGEGSHFSLALIVRLGNQQNLGSTLFKDK